MRKLRVLINLAGWVVAIIFIVLFWQRFIRSEDWTQIVADVDWGLFTLATVLLFLAQGSRAALGYISHRELGYPLKIGHVYRIWYLSQIGKYIPGGVWLFAARVVWYRRLGMPTLIASAAAIWEVLSTIITGLLIGVASIVLISDRDLALTISGLAFVLVAGIVVSVLPAAWQIMAGFKLPGAQRMLTVLSELGAGRYRLLAQLSGLSLVVWLVTGIGFYVLVAALVDVQNLTLWYAIVTFAVSWTIGFLVIIAPTGLGAREAMIALFLTPIYGFSLAFSIALLARLWWVVAEWIHIALAALLQVTSTAHVPAQTPTAQNVDETSLSP